jgi:hypothetical protein
MTGTRGEARRSALERRRSRRRVLLWGSLAVVACGLVLGSGVGLLLNARDLQDGAGLHGTWTAVATYCTGSGGQCVTWIGTFAPDGGDVSASGVQMDAGEVSGAGQSLHGQLFDGRFYADHASLEAQWGFGIVVALLAVLCVVGIVIVCVVKWRYYGLPANTDDPLDPMTEVDNVSLHFPTPQLLLVGQAHSGGFMGWSFVGCGIACLLGPVFLIPEESWGAAAAWIGGGTVLVLLGLVPLTESTWLTQDGITFRRWLFRSGRISWAEIEKFDSDLHPLPTGTSRSNFQITVLTKGKVALTVPSVWFGGTPIRAQANEIADHLAAWGLRHGRPPFAGRKSRQPTML